MGRPLWVLGKTTARYGVLVLCAATLCYFSSVLIRHTSRYMHMQLFGIQSQESGEHSVCVVINCQFSYCWCPDNKIMMTSSNGNIFRVTGHLCGEFTGLRWRGSLMFCLICVWINGWVNNRETGDVRRYRAHYEVSVMMNHGTLRQGSGIIWSEYMDITPH